jgi:hypothetical protein
MIAPLQTDPKRPTQSNSPHLAAARAAVAAVLLRDAQPPAVSIAVWKAWLFVGWIVFVIVTYALYMSGSISAVVEG